MGMNRIPAAEKWVSKVNKMYGPTTRTFPLSLPRGVGPKFGLGRKPGATCGENWVQIIQSFPKVD